MQIECAKIQLETSREREKKNMFSLFTHHIGLTDLIHVNTKYINTAMYEKQINT